VGWLVRTRLKLLQAGSVLLGIGGLLVAVDFAAIYQLIQPIRQISGNAYWWVASIFCTLLYAASARLIQNEFFDYIT